MVAGGIALIVISSHLHASGGIWMGIGLGGVGGAILIRAVTPWVARPPGDRP